MSSIEDRGSIDNGSSDDGRVKLAKISALQAITIALLTAVTGVATGYLSRGPAPQSAAATGTQPSTPPTPAAITQHWLVVEGVNTDDHDLVGRIVISVNGIFYSYPSKTVWAQLGPAMSIERFPLPTSTEGYRVSFGLLRNQQPGTPLPDDESQDVTTVTTFPATNLAYSLYYVSKGIKESQSTAEVRFKIE